MAATVLDQRIVEMRFDNDNFERNVQTTLGTLDTLKAKLGLLDTSKLEWDIDTKTATGIDNISSSVDTLADRFSAVGVIGKRVLENLTDSALGTAKAFADSTIGQIQTGGKQRALNLETAKFQLKGLGIQWDDIKEDIDYAVLDTAYGLDQAAKAASQIAASGISLGDDMKAALRGISGVAAMTNSDYSEIAQIFASIAGNGKVMASEFNRIGQRGLNARAALGKYLGISEEEVREIASDKDGPGIDPLTFFKAMDAEFGEHAKEANETYEGALANAKAALSRIGELYYTPFHESQRRIFNALIPAINLIKSFAAESTILERVLDRLNNKAEFFEKFFAPRGEIGAFVIGEWEGLGTVLLEEVLGAIETTSRAFFQIADRVSEAWKKIFPSTLNEKIWNIVLALQDFNANFEISDDLLDKIGGHAESVFSILKAAIKIIQAAFEVIKPFARAALEAAGLALDFFGYLAQVFLGVRSISEDLESSGSGFATFKGRVQNAGEALADWISAFRDAVREGDAFAVLAANIAGAMRWIAEALNIGIEKIKEYRKENDLTFDPKLFTIEGFFEALKKVLNGLFDLLEVGTNRIGGLFKPLTDKISEFFGYIGGNPDILVTGAKAGGIGWIAYRIGLLVNNIKSWTGLLPPAIDAFLRAFGKSLKFKAYALFAVALIGSVIAAVIAFGMMDAGALDRSIEAVLKLGRFALAVVVISWLFSTFIAFASKTVKVTRAMDSISLTFIAIGIAISSIAKSVKIISGMTGTQIITSIVTIAVIILAIGGMMALIGYWGGYDLGTTWKSIAAVSLVFFALSSIFKQLSKFKTAEDLTALIIGMLVILEALGLMVVLVSVADGTDFGTLAGVALAFYSLNKVIRSVKTLANIPEDDLARGMAALFMIYGMLILLAAVATYLGNVSKAFSAVGATFIMLAVALDIMIPAVLALGMMPEENLYQGLGALVTLMFFMTVFVAVMGFAAKHAKDILAGGVAVALMAAALDILIPAVLVFAALPEDRLEKAVGTVLTLMVFLGIFAAAMAFISSHFFAVNPALLIALAGTLVIVALAIDLFIPAILALALIPADKIAGVTTALVSLMLGMALLVTVCTLLAAIFPAAIPGLAAISVLILAIGAGMVLFAIAMTIGAVAVGVFAASLFLLFSVFTHFAQQFPIIEQFIVLLGYFGVVLVSVGIGLVVFGAGMLVAGVGLAVLSLALGLFGVMLIFAANGVIAISAALEFMAQHIDVVVDKRDAIISVSEALVSFGLAMMVLGVGGIVMAAGVAAFSAAMYVAAGALVAVGTGLAILGLGFESLTRSIANSTRIIVNMFGALIDYAFGVAEAIAIVTGKISDEEVEKLKQSKDELHKALEDFKKESSLANLDEQLGKSTKELADNLGAEFREEFSHSAGKIDTDVVQNEIEKSMSEVNLDGATAPLKDKMVEVIPEGISESLIDVDPSNLSNNLSEFLAEGAGGIDITNFQSVLESNLGMSFDDMDTTQITGGIQGMLGDSLDDLDTTDFTTGLTEMIGDGFVDVGAENMGGDFVTNLFGTIDTKSEELGPATGGKSAQSYFSGWKDMVDVEAPGAGTDAVDGVMQGAEDQYVEVAAPAGESFFDEWIGGWFVKVDADAMGAGEEAVDGVIQGTENKLDDANQAGANVADAALDGANKYDDWVANGQNSVYGFIAGLTNEDSYKALDKAGKSLYNRVDKSLRRAAEIKSPSRKMAYLGDMTVEGYQNAILKGRDQLNGTFDTLLDDVSVTASLNTDTDKGQSNTLFEAVKNWYKKQDQERIDAAVKWVDTENAIKNGLMSGLEKAFGDKVDKFVADNARTLGILEAKVKFALAGQIGSNDKVAAEAIAQHLFWASYLPNADRTNTDHGLQHKHEDVKGQLAIDPFTVNQYMSDAWFEAMQKGKIGVDEKTINKYKKWASKRNLTGYDSEEEAEAAIEEAYSKIEAKYPRSVLDQINKDGVIDAFVNARTVAHDPKLVAGLLDSIYAIKLINGNPLDDKFVDKSEEYQKEFEAQRAKTNKEYLKQIDEELTRLDKIFGGLNAGYVEKDTLTGKESVKTIKNFEEALNLSYGWDSLDEYFTAMGYGKKEENSRVWAEELPRLAKNVYNELFGLGPTEPPYYDQALEFYDEALGVAYQLPTSIAKWDQFVDYVADKMKQVEEESRTVTSLWAKVEDTTEPVVYGTLIKEKSSVKDTKTREKKSSNQKGIVSKGRELTPEDNKSGFQYEQGSKAALAYAVGQINTKNAYAVQSKLNQSFANAAAKIAEEKAQQQAQQEALNKSIQKAEENNFLLGRIGSQLSKDKAVYLDSNKVVGALTNKLDKSLGINVARRGRGN